MKAELEPYTPLSDIVPFRVIFLADHAKITTWSSLGKWIPHFGKLG